MQAAASFRGCASSVRTLMNCTSSQRWRSSSRLKQRCCSVPRRRSEVAASGSGSLPILRPHRSSFRVSKQTYSTRKKMGHMQRKIKSLLLVCLVVRLDRDGRHRWWKVGLRVKLIRGLKLCKLPRRILARVNNVNYIVNYKIFARTRDLNKSRAYFFRPQ